MIPLVAAFLSGVVFALGLGISGMTQPAKVIGFLDITGTWDPSLAFVMIGAIAVYALLYPLIRRRLTPVIAPTFSLPARKDIDLRLIGGAALFGIGWGVGGFCPGPALTSIASGYPPIVIFVVAMIAGMYLYQFIEGRRARPADVLQRDVSPKPMPVYTSPAFQGRHDY
jgi:uncharacterized membrane protein YedE/YeeE